jgi:hypothetical protein
VKGDYATAEAITRGERMSAGELRKVITDYGMTLVNPPDQAFEELEFLEIVGAGPPTHGVVCDLWTVEEGLSDLSLEMYLEELTHAVYIPKIVSLHMM